MKRPDNHWTQHIERNTGEVPVWAVADYLGVPDQSVKNWADAHHGCRIVGGTSGYLIWQEDARSLEAHYKTLWGSATEEES